MNEVGIFFKFSVDWHHSISLCHIVFAFLVGFKYCAFCRRVFYSASKHRSHLYCFGKEQIRNLWSVYVIFKLQAGIDQWWQLCNFYNKIREFLGWFVRLSSLHLLHRSDSEDKEEEHLKVKVSFLYCILHSLKIKHLLLIFIVH